MPLAFISYAHEDYEHHKDVVKLAERLITEGVDVSADFYEQHPAEGWSKWMENQLRREFLLIVISPRYIAEFNQEHKSSSGSRFEGAIISSKLLSNGVSFEKIALVYFQRWVEIAPPDLLYGGTRYQVANEAGYLKLYAFLTGQNLNPKPTLGRVITLLTTDKLASAQTFSFPELCKRLWPLIEDNRRIFQNFGPNSHAAKTPVEEREVRYDLSLWYELRPKIVTNNDAVLALLRLAGSAIPRIHKEIFEKWESHIEAFKAHVGNHSIDYRAHQFPLEILPIIEKTKDE